MKEQRTRSMECNSEHRCQMCGAELSFASIQCLNCGEDVPKPEPHMSQGDVRWIVLPTAILAVPGCLLSVAGLLSTISAVGLSMVDERTRGINRFMLLQLLISSVGILMAGVSWVAAARCCWKKNWILTGIAAIAGGIMLVLVNSLDRWLIQPGNW